jgi:hypothetical protein
MNLVMMTHIAAGMLSLPAGAVAVGARKGGPLPAPFEGLPERRLA